MPFKPGQSGNPNGRPPIPKDVKAYLEARTLPALKKLWRLCRNEDPYVALPALKAFLAKRLPDLKAIEVSADEEAAETLRLTLEEAKALAALQQPTEPH